MVTTSDETQIQIFANWLMSHAKRVTTYNRKYPENHVVAATRKLRMQTDKTVPQENHGQTMLKMNSILDLKRPKFRYAWIFFQSKFSVNQSNFPVQSALKEINKVIPPGTWHKTPVILNRPICHRCDKLINAKSLGN